MSGPRARGWSGYVEQFHVDRAGITEAVLARCTDQTGSTPYEWVTHGLPAGRVVDVGCGSAPTAPLVGSQWVGVDRSRGELAAAGRRQRGPLITGSATAIPVRDGAADAVLAVMALMVIDDPASAVGELARVIRPGGMLRVLVPTDRPLSVADRARYGLLLAILGRTSLPFPSPGAATDPTGVIAPAGFEITGDERRRFCFPVADRSDAARFLDSLYLPGASRRRIGWARAATATWRGATIGVPLRLVTATRQG